MGFERQVEGFQGWEVMASGRGVCCCCWAMADDGDDEDERGERKDEELRRIRRRGATRPVAAQE